MDVQWIPSTICVCIIQWNVLFEFSGHPVAAGQPEDVHQDSTLHMILDATDAKPYFNLKLELGSKAFLALGGSRAKLQW